MGRTWFSSKRTAMPSCEAMKTICVPLVMRAATSSSPSSMLMALMPLERTCMNSRSSDFFYQAVAGGEEDVFVFFFEIAHGEHGADGLAGLQSDEIADVLAAAGGAYVGNFIDLEPVDTAFVGEDEDVGVGGGDEEVLDEIFVARFSCPCGPCLRGAACGRWRWACASCSRSG